jgi:uncharacterized membrane protein YeaQ/YmgE (transglycosylase-associated protein family)
MSLIAWILLGLIAGYIASRVVNNQGEEGFFLDIALGIAGAIVGGTFFIWMNTAGAPGFNLYSLFVAVVGAVAVLVFYHGIFGRRLAG